MRVNAILSKAFIKASLILKSGLAPWVTYSLYSSKFSSTYLTKLKRKIGGSWSSTCHLYLQK